MTNDRNAQAVRRAQLGAFLRAHRERIRPADVGLREYGEPGRRRTPGLRREEVAELAGVSLTWYTWLEQGRDITASEQVVESLSRALRLDEDQRRHLRRLAGFSTPVHATAVHEALPRLRRLVDTAAPAAATVYDHRFDYVAWNAPYALIRHDPAEMPPDRRNLMWMMFTDADNRARMTRWEAAARALLNQFRAAHGRRPGDPRLDELVGALTEVSAEFREWWPQHQVRDFRPATIGFDHAVLGRLELDLFQLRPVEHPDLLLVLQIPAGEGDLERVSALLAQRNGRGPGR